MADPSSDALARAARSYVTHQRHWNFLGYSEAIALAVLADFFSMERPRNRSEHPLNVTKMVGKSRIKAIREAVRADPGGDTEASTSDAADSDD